VAKIILDNIFEIQYLLQVGLEDSQLFEEFLVDILSIQSIAGDRMLVHSAPVPSSGGSKLLDGFTGHNRCIVPATVDPLFGGRVPRQTSGADTKVAHQMYDATRRTEIRPVEHSKEHTEASNSVNVATAPIITQVPVCRTGMSFVDATDPGK
jgi:hypothetical protein